MNGLLLSLIMAIAMATASIIYTVIKDSIENRMTPESPISNNTTFPSTDITTTMLDTSTLLTQETDTTTIKTETDKDNTPTTLETAISAENKNEYSSTILETTIEIENDEDRPTTVLTEKTSEPIIIYYPACDSSYTSLIDALKSIGEDSSMSNRKIIAKLNGISDYTGTAAQNIELLNKLKEGVLIKSISSGETTLETEIKETQYINNDVFIITPFQTIYNQSKINNMIQKLKENKNKLIQKETLIIMGSVLLNYGYELAFVSGILGNIDHEGQIGLFEDSNYKNESTMPNYLKYMNDNYNYHIKYALKFIFDFSLFEIKALLEELEKKNFTGRFGLGCVQWTGSRTLNLVNYYLKESGNREYITFDQACAAESKLIIYELANVEEFKNIYSNWKKKNTDVDTEDAAYNAAIIFKQKYEKALIKNDVERGNKAKLIYNIMKI